MILDTQYNLNRGNNTFKCYQSDVKYYVMINMPFKYVVRYVNMLLLEGKM